MDFRKCRTFRKNFRKNIKSDGAGLSPEKGRDSLLWMMIEAGEVADIIKKQGDAKITGDEQVRNHFIEELCDVLMYLNDVMLCYSISPEELAEIYREKHERNMKRW